MVLLALASTAAAAIDHRADGDGPQAGSSPASQLGAVETTLAPSPLLASTGLAAAPTTSGELLSGTVSTTDGTDAGVQIDVIGLDRPFDGGAVTDGQGRWQVTPPGEGRYLVHADGRNVGHSERWYQDDGDGVIAAADATTIEVAPGEQVEDLDVTLPESGSLSGYVTVEGDEGPEPLEGACVQADGVGGSPWTNWRTDGDGYYEVPDLVEGNYVTRLVDCDRTGQQLALWDGADGIDEASTIQVREGMTTPGADVHVDLPDNGGDPVPDPDPRESGVSGTVVDGDGAPITACVEVSGDDGNYRSPLTTSESGEFSVSSLPASAYSLVVADCREEATQATQWYPGVANPADAVEFDLGEGEEYDLGTFELDEPGDMATVSGTVTLDGEPVEGALVRTTLEGFGYGGPIAISAEDGSYELPSVAPGDIVLEAQFDGAFSRADRVELDLDPDEHRESDIDLEGAGAITGAVTSPDGSVPPWVSRSSARSEGTFDRYNGSLLRGGLFVIRDVVPADDFYVQVEDRNGAVVGVHGADDGSGSEYGDGDPVEVVAGDSTDGVDVVVDTGLPRSEPPTVTVDAQTQGIQPGEEFDATIDATSTEGIAGDVRIVVEVGGRSDRIEKTVAPEDLPLEITSTAPSDEFEVTASATLPDGTLGAGSSRFATSQLPTSTELLPLEVEASVVGQPVELVAEVHADDGSDVVGDVRFLHEQDGDITDLGTAAVSADDGGEASLVTSQLPVGDGTVTAEFSATPTLEASEDATEVTVEPADTVVVVPDPAEVDFGQAAEVTAAVEVQDPGGGTVEGELELLPQEDDADPVASEPLDEGSTATFEVDGLATGVHNFDIVYPGSDDHASSTAAISFQVISETTTTLTLDSEAGDLDQGVVPVGAELEATVEVVADDQEFDLPDGTVVTVEWGEHRTDTLELRDGAATASFDGLDVGDHELVAHYAGGDETRSSDDTTSIEVVPAVTDTTLDIDPATAVTGQSVRLEAEVTTDYGHVETGEVIFELDADDDPTELDGSPVGGNGVATVHTDDLPVGEHQITARYAGSDAWGESTATGTVVVEPAATSTSLVAEPDEVDVGEPIEVDVEVEADTPGAGTPDGGIELHADTASEPVAAAELDDGTATWSLDDLDPGEHELTASYVGSDAFDPSESTPLTVVVRARTEVELTLDPDDAVPFGAPVTATAELSVPSDDRFVPEGTVTFTSSGLTVTANVEDGTAEADLIDLDLGQSTVTADYDADGPLTDGSAEADVEVVPAPTELEVEASPADPLVGEVVSVTAEVTAEHADVDDGVVTLQRDDGDDLEVEVSGSGEATFEVDDLPVGESQLDVAFSGSDAFVDSEASTTVEVQPTPTSTTLEVDPTTAEDGTPRTLAITVEPETTTAGPPEGTVEVTRDDGAHQVATDDLDDGEVALEVEDLPPGIHELVAQYSGTVDFEPSDSDAVEVTVTAPTETTLTLGDNEIEAGGATEADIAVTADVAELAPPDGEVELTAVAADGVSPREIGNAELDDGAATIEVVGLPPGTWELIAAYAGQDANRPSEATAALLVGDSEPLVPDLGLSTTGGVAALEVDVEVDVDDPARLASWTLDPGDGSDPVEGDDPVAVTHTFDDPGVYAVRLTVEDGFGSTNSTVEIVEVVAPEPPVADAGSDRVVDAQATVTFDGSASSPSPRAASYEWDLGDGTDATGEVVEHVFDEPGTYEVTLAVSSGEQTETTSIEVEALDPTPDGLLVEVLGEGEPLSDVTVVVEEPDGRHRTAATDEHGEAVLRDLPAGEVVVYTGTNEYLPEVAEAEVDQDGRGEVTFDLEAGDTLEGDVETTRLDEEEVEDLGLDPDDPDNQHIWEADINLRVRGFGSIGRIVFREDRDGAVGIILDDLPDGWRCEDARCSTSNGSGSHSITFHGGGGSGTSNHPSLTYIVIPIEGRFLKEFFEVDFTVMNLAPPAFTAVDLQAELPLPDGLSLAPIAGGQTRTVALDDIPGGGAETARWIVRGDASGSYDLEARATGALDPLGETLEVVGETDEPLHVWGADALEMLVEPDAQVHEGYPMGLRLGFRNVSDIDVYNAQLRFLEHTENAIYQPQQQRVLRFGTIEAGTEVWAPIATLVPAVSGEIVERDSYVSEVAGDEIPDWDINVVPPMRPPSDTLEIEASGRSEHVVLRYEQVYGADAHHVFRTDDLRTQFPDEARSGVVSEGLPEDTIAVEADPEQEEGEWAVSTEIAGSPELYHPVVRTGATEDQREPRVRSTFHEGARMSCGEDVSVELTASDEFLELAAYEVDLDGEVIDAGDLSGSTATLGTYDLSAEEIAAADDGRVTITARAQDQLGGWGPTHRILIREDCPGRDVTVMAAGLFTRIDGDELPPTFGRPGDGDTPLGVLAELGHDVGHDGDGPLDAPNRTVIEYSYEGASVGTDSDGAPTFEPHDYRSRDTVYELPSIVEQPSGLVRGATTLSSSFVQRSHRAAAQEFLVALLEYDQAWFEHHGERLAFHFVGHSLGARQSLQMVDEVLQLRDGCQPGETLDEIEGYPCDQLDAVVASVTSVAGAVYPMRVVSNFDPVSCVAPTETRITHWKIALVQGGVGLAGTRERGVIDEQLHDAVDADVDLHFMGATQDACLQPRSTLPRDALAEVGRSHAVREWNVDTSIGVGAHRALLESGGMARDGDPAFPLGDRLQQQPGAAGANRQLANVGLSSMAGGISTTTAPGTVSVTVTGPRANARVLLLDADEQLIDTADLDSNGEATLEADLAGGYEVVAGGPGLAVSRADVALTPGGSADVTVEVEEAPSVVVDVVDDDGDAVPYASVDLIADGDLVETTLTDINGRGVFLDVPADEDLAVTVQDDLDIYDLPAQVFDVQAAEGSIAEMSTVAEVDVAPAEDEADPDPGDDGPGDGPPGGGPPGSGAPDDDVPDESDDPDATEDPDGTGVPDDFEDPFTDVTGDTHEDAILAVTAHGIAEGFDDGTFDPRSGVTRGQMASFLARALELESAGGSGLSDVAGTTHESAIRAVAAVGIAEGFEDGTFRPGDEVTRGQMASFLARALDLEAP